MRTVFRALAARAQTRTIFGNDPNFSHNSYYLKTLSEDRLGVKQVILWVGDGGRRRRGSTDLKLWQHQSPTTARDGGIAAVVRPSSCSWPERRLAYARRHAYALEVCA